MLFSLLKDMDSLQQAWLLGLCLVAFTCCFGALVWGASYVLASHCLA